MGYTKNFKDLIAINKDELYIGKGNPMGKILFIGKEAAIDVESSREEYSSEIKGNYLNWVNNIDNNLSQEEVQNWFEDNTSFNPLYPYKGQKNTVYSIDATGKVKGEGGASKTWFNYQKLYDKIYNKGVKSEYINFLENSFITELSEASGKKSANVDSKERIASLEKRKVFLSNTFYLDFPIIIVAAGHYVRDFDIDIEKIFNVKFDTECSTIDVTKTNYINVHYDSLKDPKRVVIHTNQLSIGITDELLEEIALKVKQFK
ncbi:hypothetical protein [Myroides profundi]|uniref:Uncharacterized protein n=1 Tax=Myroides profundi TaxID=480520 RepID=A0AAJ4W3P2_MYRPR|nr:hypothetical protein [Myroides profundi]AJH16555.1 hypothetical protein MPR_3441 [Myroides profundi]SEQ82381.1 hypothetical protein SAMN04488089_106138 [Myroides profundi]